MIELQSGPPDPRRGPGGAAARAHGRGRRRAAATTCRARPPSSPRPPAPDGGRRQAVPPAARAARRRVRCPTAEPGVLTAACVVELTHLASLYHDDVMDEADLRRGRRVGQRALGQPRRDPDRRLPVLEVLGADRRWARDAVRIQAQTFTRLVEGQILETLGPIRRQDPLEHYLRVVAGKTGSLIATSARYGAMFAGAPQDVESRRSRSTARRSASPSSSPTTSSTSPRRPRSPGRPPAPTSARACRRCPS